MNKVRFSDFKYKTICYELMQFKTKHAVSLICSIGQD